MGVALVTGSSRGFGLEACAALVAKGFRVYASMRDPSRAGRLREAIAARGFDPDEQLEVVALDVGDARAARILATEIHDAHGALDVLVNNAGVAAAGFAEEVEESELDQALEVNSLAVARLTRMFMPGMRERRRGRIINISSIGGRGAGPSKSALEGWSETLHRDLRPFNVFVCLVEPGLYPAGVFGANLRRLGPAMSAAQGPYATLASRLERSGKRTAAQLGWADPFEVGERVAELSTAESPGLHHTVGLDARISQQLEPWVMVRLWRALFGLSYPRRALRRLP